MLRGGPVKMDQGFLISDVAAVSTFVASMQRFALCLNMPLEVGGLAGALATCRTEEAFALGSLERCWCLFRFLA